MRRRQPGQTTAVFVDTSAYFALAATHDARHGEAETLLRRAVQEQRLLYTTNFVLAETHALLLHRLKPARGAPAARSTALHTVAQLYQGAEARGTLVRISPADETRAFALLAQYHDKSFSFTDATSFAVMERLGIRIAFSFDADFAQAGFLGYREPAV